MRLRWLAVVAVVLLGAGCGIQTAAPPKQPPAITVPRLSPIVEQAATATIPALIEHSFRRKAEQLTIRIRNLNCEGVAVGSGFAVTPHVLVTNRHVVAGADVLETDTWDGHSLSVNAAYVGVLGDLGIVDVSGTLPEVAKFGALPESGDLITVVGYPLGGELTLAPGLVVGRVDGNAFGIAGGDVLRLTARVEHGNSGGPVLDQHGRVVGIVFAIETATGFGLAIPIDTLLQLARAGGLQEVPACGHE